MHASVISFSNLPFMLLAIIASVVSTQHVSSNDAGKDTRLDLYYSNANLLRPIRGSSIKHDIFDIDSDSIPLLSVRSAMQVHVKSPAQKAEGGLMYKALHTVMENKKSTFHQATKSAHFAFEKYEESARAAKEYPQYRWLFTNHDALGETVKHAKTAWEVKNTAKEIIERLQSAQSKVATKSVMGPPPLKLPGTSSLMGPPPPKPPGIKPETGRKSPLGSPKSAQRTESKPKSPKRKKGEKS